MNFTFNINIFLLLGMIVVVYLYNGTDHSHKKSTDFRSFYFSSVGLLNGDGNIYDVAYLKSKAQEENFKSRLFPYLYPPVLSFYMSPIARLGLKPSMMIWYVGSILLAGFVFIRSIALSLQVNQFSEKDIKNRYDLMLFSILLITIMPVIHNLEMGQVNILVLSFIVGSLVLSSMNREMLAGLLLAPAILIKVTPLGLLVYFFMVGQYKTLYGCAVGLIVLAIPTLLSSSGVDSWYDFFNFTALISYGKSIPGLFDPSHVINISVAGLISRYSENAIVINWLTCFLLLFFALLLLFHQYKSRHKGLRELFILPYLVLMVISAPYAYVHHVFFIFPGLVITMGYLIKKREHYGDLFIVLIFLLALVSSFQFDHLYSSVKWGPEIFKALNLYALLGLFLLSLYIPYKSSQV